MPPAPIAKTAAARAAAGSRPSTPARLPYAPADPAQGLSDPEVAAILEWKKKHPSMGPVQLRAQLKRFMGWRLSIKAIARVLRGHGYALVHTKARPVGPEPVCFEAPRRNALWQADFCEVRVGEPRRRPTSPGTRSRTSRYRRRRQGQGRAWARKSNADAPDLALIREVATTGALAVAQGVQLAQLILEAHVAGDRVREVSVAERA